MQSRQDVPKRNLPVGILVDLIVVLITKGKLYECVPQSLKGNPQLKEFVDMCFDPSSPANARLKDTLLKLLEEQKNNG